jgi:acetyl-CoA synthetase
LFEGSPTYPGPERILETIAKYRVDKFYSTPTDVRTLASAAPASIKRRDLSSLKLLALAREPIEPDVWKWYRHNIGKDECPIIDTFCQIEAGGILITPIPGVHPLRPGSCSFPFLGIEPVILDPDTGEEAEYPNQEGVLCIKKPWPGMGRTILDDHERFVEIYYNRVPGMYFTGDGAKKDEDGHYFVSGRIDEVINSGGHRLGASEIESALVRHKSAVEAAVVGFPHPVKGQGIYAFVTIADGVAASEELLSEFNDLVRDEIGTAINIDAIQWTKALPRTRSGKVLRQLLRKIAAGVLDEFDDMPAMVDSHLLESLIKDRRALL